MKMATAPSHPPMLAQSLAQVGQTWRSYAVAHLLWKQANRLGTGRRLRIRHDVSGNLGCPRLTCELAHSVERIVYLTPPAAPRRDARSVERLARLGIYYRPAMSFT